MAFSFLACPIIAPTYAADDDEELEELEEDDEDDFVEEESKKSECDPSVFTKKCEDNGGTVGDYDDKTKICSITLSGSVKFENIKNQVKKTAKTICDNIGKKVIHNTSHNKWDIVCHVDCATGWFSLNVPNVKCPDDHTFNSDSGKCEKDESEKEEVVEAEKKEEEKPKEEEKKEEVKEEPKPEETPAKEEEKKEEVAQDSGDTGSDANADAAGTVAPEKPAKEKPAEEKKAPDGKVEVDEKQIKRGKSNDRFNTTDMTMKTCGDAKQFLVKNNKLKSDASCECGEDYLDCGNSMQMFNKIERPNDWTVTISTQQQENTKAETDEKSDEYKKCKGALLLDITAIKNGNGKRLVIPDSDVNDIKKRLNEYKKKKNKAPDEAVQRDVLEKYCGDKSADADGTNSSSENFENEKSVHDFDDKSPASFDEATELISGWGKKNNVDFDKCEPSRGRTYVNCTAKNNGTYYTFYFTKIGDPDTDKLEKEFRAYAQKILNAHNAMFDTIKAKSATSETTEKPAEEQKS